MPAIDRIRKVTAIVIAHAEYGEADRFVRIFTLENGKLNTLAKGVRKIQSRKAAHLEPFTHSALVLARGQSFWIITQAETLNAFTGIHDDLKKTTDAAYVLELVDKIAGENHPEPGLYRLLLDTLKRIEAASDTFNALRYFEFRFLDTAGFRPELTNCVACKKPIQPEDQYFSVLQGGILCPQCGQMEARSIFAAKDTLRYLRHFQRSAYPEVETINVPENTRMEMQKIMNVYIAAVMEGQLKTPGFQRQIEGVRGRRKYNDIK
jgi:DNA repair protein RecO (recombination protein O)